MDAVKDVDPFGLDQKVRAFSLCTDLETLKVATERIENCRLVIIDPISAYLGSETDSHKGAEVQALLAPLATFAAQQGVAVIAVSHLNKSKGGPAVYRAMGSLAFVAVARSAWTIARDPNDAENERRLLLPIKNNIGNDSKGFAYTLEESENGQPKLNWSSEPVTLTADDVLNGGERPPSPARQRAMDLLSRFLADGARGWVP